MLARKGERLATACTVNEAQKAVSTSKRDRSPSKPSSSSPQPIRAELAWSDAATALGIVARSASPILDLCRLLIEGGYDPATPLEAWRAGTLCLRVDTIGIAARLEINSKGTGFIAARDVRIAPPMCANGRVRP